MQPRSATLRSGPAPRTSRRARRPLRHPAQRLEAARRASGFGSSEPATTREMPAASTRSAQGGVVPQWAQGSIVTYSVASRASSPAASSATTSPCRPPCSVTPSPTISPSCRTTGTAPTVEDLGTTHVPPLDGRARPRGQSSCERLYQPAICPRQILAFEDRSADDDHGRTGLVERADRIVGQLALNLQAARLAESNSQAYERSATESAESIDGDRRPDRRLRGSEADLDAQRDT